MGWGDPGELVELNGASGKTWQLRFAKLVWPLREDPDAASTVYMMKENIPNGKMYIAKTQFADSEEDMEDLIAEAASWRKISLENNNQWPPNIVELHDAFITRGEDSSVVYLMELGEKGNLPKPLPEDQVVKALQEISNGVRSVLNSGLPCHGYVAHSNVVVSSKGVAKLAGFGAGRARILRLHPQLSEKDDVAAIGRLGFELLVGRPPSRTETTLPKQAMLSIRIREAIDAAMAPPQSRPGLEAFTRMLSEGVQAGLMSETSMKGDLKSRGGLPPVASMSMRRGMSAAPPPPAAGMGRPPPSQSRSSLMDAVNQVSQASIRGAVPPAGAPQAAGQQGYDSGSGGGPGGLARKSSVMEAVATASRRGGDMLRNGDAGLGSRRMSMDPFGLAQRTSAPGEKAKDVSELLSKITDPDVTVFDAESMKNLLTLLHEAKASPDVFRVLFKRPISVDPVIAFKTLTAVHLMMAEGPLEFIDMTLRQAKFFEWIESSWSVDAVQANMDKHKFNFAFMNGEISKYASFLRLKAIFHYKAAYAFHGDWSRSDMLSEAGGDAVQGRERKILAGIADMMDLAEDVAGSVILGQDPCRNVKIVSFPVLVGEIIHGYEAACELVDSIENLHTRRKLVPAFNRCHNSARNVLMALNASPDLSSKVSPEMAGMEIDENPPDIAAEPEPEPVVDLSYTDEVDKGEKKKKKKKKKKDEEEAVVEDSTENPEDGGAAAAEGAVVPFQENKIGLLVRYATEHDGEAPEEEPVERAANPNVENAGLLADILGEAPTAEEGGEAGGLVGNSMALALTDEAREQERATLREARENSAAYSMALTVVGEAPVFEKTHPQFCHCAMCETTTAVQNMTVYGAGDEDENIDQTPVDATTEIPEKFIINGKDVKIGQAIGEGGFGAVYKGKYKRKEVAVKKIQKAYLQDEAIYEALKKEVALMSQLEHKNVLKLVGAYPKKNNFMMLFEYMTRGSLFDMIHKARARLTWPIVKKLATNLAQGMAYLHASKVMHRDLKTANIMVDEDFSVKIGDFGIAVILSGEDDDSSERHGLAGTLQYMAPEVIQKLPFTEKSDVYSFGVVLWEMVSMELPYAGVDPQVAADQVMNNGFRPQIPPFCPQPLAVLISSCWNQEPTLRPSFVQIQELLKRIPG